MILAKLQLILMTSFSITVHATYAHLHLSVLPFGSLRENGIAQYDSQIASNNPYLYSCDLSSSQCYTYCYTGGATSSDYYFCYCYCGGQSCSQNEDCCTNICNNGICDSTGGQQGTVCNGLCDSGEIGCAPGYECTSWGLFGYCNYNQTALSSTIGIQTTTPSLIADNPFLYPCTSDNQCNNEIHRCDEGNGPNSSYSFCVCTYGGYTCLQNEDCCTNICQDNVCSSTGGTQGCMCDETGGSSCASEYVCQPWGLHYGYCDYTDSTASTSGPLSVTTTFADMNPYLYPCTSNLQCNNTIHQCAKNGGSDSAFWYCSCYCGGGPCKMNGDCSTNICNNGICAATGGLQGTVCSSDCGDTNQCAPGYVCQPWGDFGYCNYSPLGSGGTLPLSTAGNGRRQSQGTTRTHHSSSGGTNTFQVEYEPSTGIEYIEDPIQSQDSCKVVNVCAALQLKKESNIFYFPECIDMPQCLGGCCDNSHNCHPVESQTVRVKVSAWKYDGIVNGQQTFSPHEQIMVDIQRHIRCGCEMCINKPECDTDHILVGCKCVCKNHRESLNCIGERRYWSDDTCTCECQRNHCFNNQVFSERECKCQTLDNYLTLNPTTNISLGVSYAPRIHKATSRLTLRTNKNKN